MIGGAFPLQRFRRAITPLPAVTAYHVQPHHKPVTIMAIGPLYDLFIHSNRLTASSPPSVSSAC
jgi:hypothetical protein